MESGNDQRSRSRETVSRRAPHDPQLLPVEKKLGMVEKRNALSWVAMAGSHRPISTESSPNEHWTAGGTIIGPGPLITFFTWIKFEVTQISRRQSAHSSHSQSRESRRIRLTRTAGRSCEGLSSKKSSPHPHQHPPTHALHPSSYSHLFAPAAGTLAEGPR